jgi:stage V sporulation protein G
MQVQCTFLDLHPKNAGKLLALADVELDFEGVAITINSIRLEREANGVSVRMPIDRDGRPLVILPDEVKDGISDIVLEAGLEAGIVKERVKVSIDVGRG